MRAECLAARRDILLGEAGSASVRRHLAGCDACREFQAEELSVARLVRERAAAPAAPRSLRERVLSALETERRRASRAGRRLRTRVLSAAAAAVVLALASVGAYVLWGAAEARRMVDALGSDHLKFALADGGIEFTSSTPEEIGAWLKERLRLAAKVPALPDAALLGARRCSVRSRPAGLIFYSLRPPAGRHESKASLFVFAGGGATWSNMDRFSGDGSREIFRAYHQGLSILVWEERGLTYAFVTELPEGELRSVARYL